MKSYVLAITVTMFLSALFAFQNIGDVTVRFLVFEWVLPQGVWEVLVFCAGAAIMWIFSIFSMFEARGKYKKELKAKDERIAAVEKEKKTILESVAASRSNFPMNEDTARRENTKDDPTDGTVE